MSSATVEYLLTKAVSGERIFFDEALKLYQEADLSELGEAANTVRQIRVPGRVVTYIIDRNINYTNVCVTNCQFCGYHRPPGDPEGFVCSREELAEKIEALIAAGGTRVLLQGGHNPDLTLDWYTDLLTWLRATYPKIERDCFSPSEIWHLAQRSGLNTRDVLIELQQAGLQGLPGESAEILDDELRRQLSPKKQGVDSWLGTMREAQKLGLNTTATMVIGLGESLEQRIYHLQRVRALQDYSMREHGNGFTAFTAWTVQHSARAAISRSSFRDKYGATSQEYLRHVAISRLFLDNIMHHQVNWETQSSKVSQQALNFGLDDFGSAALEASVFAMSRNGNGTALREGEMCSLIHQAGYTPARRDTAYNVLHIFEHPDEMPKPAPIDTSAPIGIIPLQTSLN